MVKLTTHQLLTKEQTAQNPNIPEDCQAKHVFLFKDKCETEHDCLLGVKLAIGTCTHYGCDGTKEIKPWLCGLCYIDEDNLEKWIQEEPYEDLTKDASTSFFDYCPRCGRKINWDKFVPNGNSLDKAGLMIALMANATKAQGLVF